MGFSWVSSITQRKKTRLTRLHLMYAYQSLVKHQKPSYLSWFHLSWKHARSVILIFFSFQIRDLNKWQWAPHLPPHLWTDSWGYYFIFSPFDIGLILAFLGPSLPVHWMQNGRAAARVADEKKIKEGKWTEIQNRKERTKSRLEHKWSWEMDRGWGLVLLAISPLVVKVHWLFESLRSSNLFL